jgi:hypothetical protein
MELFGIALWILGGIVAAPLFCYGVVHFIKPKQYLSSAIFYVAMLGTALFAIDLVLVGVLGSVGARALVGPVYFPFHALVTLLSAGSLACTLLLGPWRLSSRWLTIAAVCWAVGVFAILFQYNVSETLYGVDGLGGPYSESSSQMR